MIPPHRDSPQGAPPANPVLARVLRGAHVESEHRGAWALVDDAGNVLDGAGDWNRPVFARSSMKSLQALPLFESGAAERFGLSPREIALVLASHNAEACHTEGVAGLLARLGLDAGALGCGAQSPGDPEARAQLAQRGEQPSALHNNCSGKHAGFLALARQLDEDPARYLQVESRTQGLVRQAVLEMTGTPDDELTTAIDGCSAPTFRLPLAKLATGIARVANPESLSEVRRGACLRMTDAVAAHPELIAGKHRRICTDIARVAGGRVFPKTGAEAVYVLGLVGTGRGLAVKIDDGSYRGLHALIVDLLARFELLSPGELHTLDTWRGDPLRNWAGQVVGRIEIVA